MQRAGSQQQLRKVIDGEKHNKLSKQDKLFNKPYSCSAIRFAWPHDQRKKTTSRIRDREWWRSSKSQENSAASHTDSTSSIGVCP
jgi:hypothetical protein